MPSRRRSNRPTDRRPRPGKSKDRAVRWSTLEPLEPRQLLATFVVDSNSDDPQDPLVTLRDAILAANANAGPDTIIFDLPGSTTIQPLTALPPITEVLFLDGTQGGTFTTPVIELDGSFAGTTAPGLSLSLNAAGSTILGLVINRFGGSGIQVLSSSNLLVGNYIGVDVSGTVGLGNGQNGIDLQSSSNTVGGLGGARNVISSNAFDGVLVQRDQNLLLNNFVGTNTAGNAALANGGGIRVNGSGNTIGAFNDSPGILSRGNLLSGNSTAGLYLNGAGNLALGNFAGTDVSGTFAVGNANEGIVVLGGSANTVGSANSFGRNLLSGNGTAGIGLDATASRNVILGNLIGSDSTSGAALPNLGSGVLILGDFNTVGGTSPGARNEINGNALDGITIAVEGASNVIRGNTIGADSDDQPLPNSQNGIRVLGADNTISGDFDGRANVIANNSVSGISLEGPGATGNALFGNFIGTDQFGSSARGNGGPGVTIAAGAHSNQIGVPGFERNIISGNAGPGVLITGSATRSNTVLRNRIGSDLNGTAAVANGFSGILIEGSRSNTIGGLVASRANLIAGNTNDGVRITDPGASANIIIGNIIGANLGGTVALANTDRGVAVLGGATANTIGGLSAGARNLISGNRGDGVGLADPATQNNLVVGNFIGTDPAGTAALANGGSGIGIAANANTVGGTQAGATNLISGNAANGITIAADASANLLLGNFIGTNRTGAAALANQGDGVQIAGVDNTVGGSTDPARNLLSGNRSSGLALVAGASRNLAIGNFIGLSAAGNQAIGNLDSGVELSAASTSDNTVGGGTGQYNIISGNAGFGLFLLNATNNVLGGNVVGTNPAVSQAVPNAFGGIALIGADSNQIRDSYISGNTGPGIFLDHDATGFLTRSTSIDGNVIGLNGSGSAALGNTQEGIRIEGASGTNIGQGRRNFISANGAVGINLSGAQSGQTLIQSNRIGTDLSGTVALGNGFQGIFIDSSIDNTVGGNVISGNAGNGIRVAAITAAAPSGNLISGNFIGTDATGTLAIPNDANGVELDGDASTVIGGTDPGQRNLISGNAMSGVKATGSTGLIVLGNSIGVDTTGGLALGNGRYGILGQGLDAANIGGTSIGAGNLISGNAADGVGSFQTVSLFVQGNRIGTTGDGTAALANQGAGVRISGGFILDAATIVGNLISGNNGTGVSLEGNSTSIVRNVRVASNTIGLDVDGTRPLGNRDQGIRLVQASDNTIGGPATADRNLIGANGAAGIRLDTFRQIQSNFGVENTFIQGNFIGTDAAGTLALGNAGAGVQIIDGVDNTVGGFAFGLGNTIANNGGAGVQVLQSAGVSDAALGTNNAVLSNRIFANSGLGIDLGPAVAPPGPNRLQAAPVINGFTVDPSNQFRVVGTFIGLANSDYSLQFFSDSNGGALAEGRTLLGTGTAATNAGGAGTFSVVINQPFTTEPFVTGTATDPTGNTSEFSAPVEIAGVLSFQSAFQSVLENQPGGFLDVTVIRQGGSGGRVTADFAAVGVNAVPGVDFPPQSGQVVFDDGQTSATIRLTILDDSEADGLKLIDVTLSNPTNGASLGFPSTLRVAVDDDESPAPFIAAFNASNLTSFWSANPTEFFQRFTISGLSTTEETLVGFDFRPADLLLYGVSDLGNLYTVDFRTGRATRVGTGSVALETPTIGFGVDFNPTVDRLRVVNDLDESFAVNPTDGIGVQSPPLAYASDDPNVSSNPTIVGVAYTNSFVGATSTTLFGIDVALGNLVTIDPASGIVRTVGSLGLGTNLGTLGFDIKPDNVNAFAVIRQQDVFNPGLYLIDLATGTASLVSTASNVITSDAAGIAIIPRGPLRIDPFDPAFQSPDTLIDALLLPNGGINVIEPSTSPYVGAAGQAGLFRDFNLRDPNNATSLNNGILLTSGMARFAAEPNIVTGRSAVTGSGSDAELGALIDATTNDANSLTFRFRVDPGILSIQLQVLFASEEFPEFVGEFNDAFAAFLDGVQISFDDMFRLLTVNNNFFSLNNTGLTEADDPDIAGKTPVDYSHQIQYGGLTPTLILQAPLNPDLAIHELKFVIADATDSALDSAIFLSSLRGLDFLVPLGPFVDPADLVVTKSVDAATVAIGDEVTFTIDVKNIGAGKAVSTILTDRLPDGFEFVSSSAGTFADGVLTVPIGDLDPNAMTTITLVAIPRDAGTFINEARGRTTTPDINPDNDRGTVTIVVIDDVPFDFVVRNTNDSGLGSLRAAIESANRSPGLDNIVFEFSTPGPFHIILLSGLPQITEALILDARSVPGGLVELDGSQAGPADGLSLRGHSGSLIAGFVIGRYAGNGISLVDVSDTLIVGNLIGTESRGLLPQGNALSGVSILGASTGNAIGGVGAGNLIAANGENGISIVGDPETGVFFSSTIIQGNLIGVAAGGVGVLPNGGSGVFLLRTAANSVGGPNPGEGNLINGGQGAGVYLREAESNSITNNNIGGGPDGLLSLGSAGLGILLERSFQNTIDGNRISSQAAGGIALADTSTFNRIVGNQVGDFGPGLAGNGVGILVTGSSSNEILGNLIGGNAGPGILLNLNAGNNRIAGNLIGINAGGLVARPNRDAGISIDGGAGNTVGGITPDERNIISGNGLGIEIAGPASSGNLIIGNFIGTTADGSAPAPNFTNGIFIDNAPFNVIGGVDPALSNLISGNQVGLQIFGPGAARNLVQGNRIGTNLAGDQAIPNQLDGVYIENAPDNLIGGDTPGAGNLISGNGIVNVQITGAQASGNLVLGNIIGTSLAGDGVLGRTNTGVFIENAPGNFIGLGTDNAGNLISGHTSVGVYVFGPGSTGNSVAGNRIGTDATGRRRIPNGDGVVLDGASNNVVGSASLADGNLISGNQVGVRIAGTGATGNAIVGNLIGTEFDGRDALPNALAGVFISDAAGNFVGLPEMGNLISGNGGTGIQILGATSSGNVVSANKIGTDPTGTIPLGNQEGGVFINNAPGNTIGGTADGAGNQISSNGVAGIQIFGQQAIDNVIVGNIIGTEQDGRPELGNPFGLFLNLASAGGIGGSSLSSSNIIRNNRFEDVLILGQGQGPRVSLVTPIVDGDSIVGFRLSFSERLTERSAVRLRNYRVNLRNGRRLGAAIRIASATYDDLALTVTIRLANPLGRNADFRLTALGTGVAPITDRRGLRLDGDLDGQPGGNFVVDFNDGQPITANRSVASSAVDHILDNGGIRLKRRR